MALIIPEAQTPFSLVEQPRIPQGMATGAEGIGALADAGIEIATRKRKAEEDRTLRQARLAAVDALDAARLEYETTGDLDGLTQRWQDQAGAITAEIAKRLPKHLQKDFALGMGEMVAPQTSAIRRREYSLFADRETASLNSDLRAYEKAAANAPTDDAAAAIYRDAASSIGAAQDAGLISAVEADRMMNDLPGNAERIRAVTMVLEDPQGYLDWREAGGGSFLSPEEDARFKLDAKSSLAAADAKRLKEEELLAKAEDTRLAAETAKAIDILDAGLPYKGLADLLGQTKGTAHHDRLVSAVDASGASATFARMTPAEQTAELDRLRSTATADPAVPVQIERLEGIAKRTTEGLASDRIGFIRDREIMPITPLDIADPASVARRRAEAETIHRDFTPAATEIIYLDKAQADQLAAVVSGPDTDQALGVLSAVAQNFGEAAPAVLAQIGAKDSVAYLAGALLVETGDLSNARAMLRGRAMLKEGKGATTAIDTTRATRAKLAPAPDRLTAFPTPDDPRIKSLMEGGEAIYAATGYAVTDPASEAAADAYWAAVQAAAGQTSRGGVTYGGIQDVNERQTLLPPDLTADQVERAIVYFDEPQWKRASLTGNLPEGFGNYTQGTREDWTAMSLPDGSYALGYRRGDGSVVYLRDKGQKDGLFRFDLHLLVKGVK